MGDRTDKYQRPELCLGSYEFIATKDYCKNGQFPNPPAFIFMIDVSYNSIRNGMVKLLCENMKKILMNLPRENGVDKSKMKVGFVTYSNVVHFYNVKGNLAQPQMLVVSDVSDMFMPLLDGFLVNVEEAESVIETLMEEIPLMFADSRETETILGPVIQAGLEALKAADCSGKLLIFHTTLPIAEAPGKLKNRDDRKLLGSEKEKTILTPQTTFYNNLGQDCVAAGCCVDLFLFPNAFIDIATLGQVCRLTGGQLYKYSYFQADIDGHRFLEDLQRTVEKCVAFDAIMRVRTSTGIRPTEFYGNYFMSNTTDVELASVDCYKAITACIKYDDKLVEEEGAYFQTAILYTSCSGQRRLRIHNLVLNTCSQMADLYRNCELDTIMNTFAKEGIRLISEQNPKAVKDNFITRSAQILACYRKNCANPSSAGQLILPECMKLLPLYVNCLIKCDALAGGPEMSTDDRSFIMLALNSMDVNASAGYLYPRLLPLHDVDVDSEELPIALRCSVEKVKDNGAYLLENGIYLFLWIGHSVNPEWIQDVFGVQAAARIDIDKTLLLELNTPLSKRIRGIIEQVRNERQRYMRLIIVRQGDKLEVLFRQFLVEDRSSDGSASYVDFLCHLHKEIRSLVT
ncbi:protein transport protein Sec24C-like [Centruroides sculpturatus]|uniref:protein transport protein Sec24C-like n=1 Tax=Centruroides sculpturatus TaxID=218467 RepID=UPI000C6E48BF|nr:protein transport protein Sec24C-like [Centruroides sculpturatus]